MKQLEANKADKEQEELLRQKELEMARAKMHEKAEEQRKIFREQIERQKAAQQKQAEKF